MLSLMVVFLVWSITASHLSSIYNKHCCNLPRIDVHQQRRNGTQRRSLWVRQLTNIVVVAIIMSTCFCYRNIIGRSFTSSRRWISSESMDRRRLPVPLASIKSLLSSGGSSKCRRSFHHPTTPMWNVSSDTTTNKDDKPTLEDATTTSTTTNNNSNNNSNMKKMLFPWQPLPRNRQAEPNEHSAFNFWMDIFSGTNFIEGLSRRQGVVEKSAFVRIEKNLRALFFLNISMTQSLFETGWISDLVDSSAWAFAHAVGTVLSNMSHDGKVLFECT